MSAQQWYEHSLKHWKTTEDTLIILPLLLDGILFYVDIRYLTKAWQWLAELEAVMQTTDNPVSAAALLEAQGMIEAAEGKMEQCIKGPSSSAGLDGTRKVGSSAIGHRAKQS